MLCRGGVMFFFCVENCDLKLDFNKEDLRRSSRER